MKSLRSQSHKHCLTTPAAMKQSTNAPVHFWSKPCFKNTIWNHLSPVLVVQCRLWELLKESNQYKEIRSECPVQSDQTKSGGVICFHMPGSCNVEMIFRRLKKIMLLQKYFGKGATVAKWVLRQSARVVQGGSQWCAVRDASTRLTLGPSFPSFCIFLIMSDYL